MDETLEWLMRGLKAQQAVDAILAPEQQVRERQRDGSYRVICNHCGKSVSNPLPVPVIVRAAVQCPECYEKAMGIGDDKRAVSTDR